MHGERIKKGTLLYQITLTHFPSARLPYKTSTCNEKRVFSLCSVCRRETFRYVLGVCVPKGNISLCSACRRETFRYVLRAEGKHFVMFCVSACRRETFRYVLRVCVPKGNISLCSACLRAEGKHFIMFCVSACRRETFPAPSLNTFYCHVMHSTEVRRPPTHGRLE